MNAPLARFLTRFSDIETPLALAFDPSPPEPVLILPENDFNDRLAATREEAVSEAEAAAAAQIHALTALHETALAKALADARTSWAADEGAMHAALLGQSFADLRETLSQCIAAALKPLLAAALVDRAQTAIGDALDHMFADPDHPVVTVRGPADLLERIHEARAATASVERVSYVASGQLEITVDAAGTHVETQLVAALAALREV